VTLFKIYGDLLESYRVSKKRGLDGEFILYRIYRPLSFPPSALLIKLGFSANQVTLSSLVALLIAAGLFLTGEQLYMTLGALSYALAFLLDFADGNIARFHNKSNYFGKLIDGFVDSLSCILFIAIAIGDTRASLNIMPAGLELALGVVTALAILVTHYYRMRVAYFLKESGVIEQSPDTLRSRAESGRSLINLANKVYKNLATSTPIVLLVLTPLGLLSVFIGFFFTTHVLMGLSEIVVSLIRLRRRLNVYREY
jgi:phosphatidylglycerophosphate synthase